MEDFKKKIIDLVELVAENSNTSFSKVKVGSLLFYKTNNNYGVSIGSKLEVSNFGGSLPSEKIALWSAITENVKSKDFLFMITNGNKETANGICNEVGFHYLYNTNEIDLLHVNKNEIEQITKVIDEKINELKNIKEKQDKKSIDYINEETLSLLYSESNKVQQSAYSKYSKYNVGAAIQTKDGSIFTGCNIEVQEKGNEDYSNTICAERTAIGKMVSHGYKSGDANLIVVTASSFGFSPCGNCRQVISDMEIPYVSYFYKNENDCKIVPLDDLIIDRFSLIESENKRIVKNEIKEKEFNYHNLIKEKENELSVNLFRFIAPPASGKTWFVEKYAKFFEDKYGDNILFFEDEDVEVLKIAKVMFPNDDFKGNVDNIVNKYGVSILEDLYKEVSTNLKIKSFLNPNCIYLCSRGGYSGMAMKEMKNKQFIGNKRLLHIDSDFESIILPNKRKRELKKGNVFNDVFEIEKYKNKIKDLKNKYISMCGDKYNIKFEENTPLALEKALAFFDDIMLKDSDLLNILKINQLDKKEEEVNENKETNNKKYVASLKN
jgi:cytidine deaminase